MDSVFITGASGLLGSEVVNQLNKTNIAILGQYYKNIPDIRKNTKWIGGDFSSLDSLKLFLNENRDDLKKCKYFINCYGPLNYRDTKELDTSDFQEAFFSNVLIPIEIINFFLNQKKPNLRSVVNIGFELSGMIKPVRYVLPYMMAKNALLEYSISLAGIHKNTLFNMISPKTIDGALIPSKSGESVPLSLVAERVINVLFGKKTGLNIFI